MSLCSNLSYEITIVIVCFDVKSVVVHDGRWFAVVEVDWEDSSVVGRPVDQQYAADDAAPAGRVQWVPQPAQTTEARGERQAGDDVQHSADQTSTQWSTGVPPRSRKTRICKCVVMLLAFLDSHFRRLQCLVLLLLLIHTQDADAIHKQRER